jgi:hypothetical protein
MGRDPLDRGAGPIGAAIRQKIDHGSLQVFGHAPGRWADVVCRGLTDPSSEINFTGRALIHIKALAPVAGLVMLS